MECERVRKVVRGHTSLKDFDKLLSIQRFPLLQCRRNIVQLLAMVGENLADALVLLAYNCLHLAVQSFGDLLAEVPLICQFAAEEGVLLLVADLQRTHFCAHSVLRHHVACQAGDDLNVAGCAGGDISEDNFFCDATPQPNCDAVDKIGALGQVPVPLRHHQDEAASRSSRYDRDLDQRIGVLHKVGDDGMSGFVVGYPFLFLWQHDTAAALRTTHGDSLD